MAPPMSVDLILALIPVALTGLVGLGVARWLLKMSWLTAAGLSAMLMVMLLAFLRFGWIAVLVCWGLTAVWVIGLRAVRRLRR